MEPYLILDTKTSKALGGRTHHIRPCARNFSYAPQWPMPITCAFIGDSVPIPVMIIYVYDDGYTYDNLRVWGEKSNRDGWHLPEEPQPCK